MSRTRWLLGGFLFVSLGAAFVQALIDPHPDQVIEDLRMSSENTQPWGVRGLYLWLQELGYDARSFREPLTALSGEQRALFLLEPAEPPTPGQLDALFAWVENGGVLFLAPGYHPSIEERLEDWVVFANDETEADAVRGDRMVSDEGWRWRYREVNAADRGMFSYPVAEVAVSGERRVADPAGEGSVLFAREDLGLVAEIYRGDGAFVVFPEGDWLTNRGLRKADNVNLMASLLTDWVDPATEIWFDEYSHGARLAGSLEAFLARRRPGLVALTLLCVGILAVFRYGRGLITRSDASEARRRRPSEFVEALASLYQHSHATAPAWNTLAKSGERIVRGDFPGLGTRRLNPGELERHRARIETALALGRSPSRRTEEDLVALANAIAETLGATHRVDPRATPSSTRKETR